MSLEMRMPFNEAVHYRTASSAETSDFTLHPDIKAAWLEALRSGRYKQDTNALCTDALSHRPGYCCLGVLCHILGVPNEHMSAATMPRKIGLRAMSEPTEIVFDFMVAMPKEDRWTSLAALNDNTRLSFKEIADIIEQQVPTHA